MAFGVYLHIPYCPAKCSYCDFYSAGGSTCVPEEYVRALARSWQREQARLGLSSRPDTLYFGGGTPGLLTPGQAAFLIQTINPRPGAEVTLETNPELVTPGSLEAFRAAGVTRISFGVQTALDDSLARLGRRHTAAQARAALQAAVAAGFQSVCGDIMLALPHYSREEFDRTLDLIAGAGAHHISAYLLKIEENTVFGRRPPAGLPDEDQACDYYLYAVEQLARAGFEQYEISNFCRPGHQGRHNMIYWDCGDYLGLGPAAHSCVGGRRFYWPSRLQNFIAGRLAPVEDGLCTGEDFLMLQLRLAKGLSLPRLEKDWGLTLSPANLAFLRQCVTAGYALFDGSTLRLTPSGLIVQNSILAGLLP